MPHRFVAIVLLCVSCAFAEPATFPTTGPTTNPSVTEHDITLDGATMHYRATAGTAPLLDDAGKPRANVYYTAYEKLPVDLARPITFVFNGGPGAASVWLHLGTVGPMRVDLRDDGTAGPPPYRVVPNESSWLDKTDVVLIDPVGTGYSRMIEGRKPEEFYGVEQDAAAVADFIRTFTTTHERWSSPKFLAGESYGTTRAAKLSEVLSDRYGLALNGVILISAVLDFNTLRGGDGNDAMYPLFLPTYAAVAHFHGRLSKDLQDQPVEAVVRESEKFAATKLTPALAAGTMMNADEFKGVVEGVSRYSGLDVGLVSRARGRIDPGVFRKNILANERKVVGRFDGRVTGTDPDPVAASTWFDPSHGQYTLVYTAAIHDYLRRELKFESTLFYEVLASLGRWDFGSSPLYVADDLRSAMIDNPHLKVLVCSGYYDLATPAFGTDLTFARLDLPDALRANITFAYFGGGHMMYHVPSERAKLKADVAKLIDSATARPAK